jgi:tellurite resistance protein TerC
MRSGAVLELATLLSLGVIAVILAVTTVASLAKVRRDPSARAHATSVRAPCPHTGRARGRWVNLR